MQTILVDGSNVVRGMYRIDQQPDFDYEAKISEGVISYLQTLNADNTRIIEVYFDGCKRYMYCPEGIQIFFSAHKKADDLIVNAVYEYSSQYANDVLVITSDNDLINRSRQYGASIQYTYEFLRQLHQDFVYTA